MNEAILIGRIGSEPELKKTQSGLSVMEFPLAVDRPRRSGEDSVTDWIDVQAWRGTADFIKSYFAKGDPIVVKGQLRASIWEDDQGKKHKRVFVLAENVEFVPRNKERNAAGANAEGQTATFEQKATSFIPKAESAVQSRTVAIPATEEFERVEFPDEGLPF